MNTHQSQRESILSPDLMRPSISGSSALNLGYIDEEGLYVVPDRTTQLEIMRLYMFMHDNKQDYVNEILKKDKKFQPSLGGSRSNTRIGADKSMFSFKPQIAHKSRNLAENYKKTFADRLTNLI